MSTLSPKRLAAVANMLARGDWRAAHEIVQGDDDSPLSCWAHGIVHLMEGNTANARYWYRAAGRDFPSLPSFPKEIASFKKALGNARSGERAAASISRRRRPGKDT